MITTTLPDGSTITYEAVKTMILKPDAVTGGGAPSVDEQVDAAVRAFMVTSGRSYQESLSLVLQLKPELRRAWLKESRGGR